MEIFSVHKFDQIWFYASINIGKELVTCKVFKWVLKNTSSEYRKTLQASTEKHFKQVLKNTLSKFWKTQSQIH